MESGDVDLAMYVRDLGGLYDVKEHCRVLMYPDPDHINTFSIKFIAPTKTATNYVL